MIEFLQRAEAPVGRKFPLSTRDTGIVYFCIYSIAHFYAILDPLVPFRSR
jgi:hypothetical protein